MALLFSPSSAPLSRIAVLLYLFFMVIVCCFWRSGDPYLSFTGARSALFDLRDKFQMLAHSQGQLTNTFAFSNATFQCEKTTKQLTSRRRQNIKLKAFGNLEITVWSQFVCEICCSLNLQKYSLACQPGNMVKQKIWWFSADGIHGSAFAKAFPILMTSMPSLRSLARSTRKNFKSVLLVIFWCFLMVVIS